MNMQTPIPTVLTGVRLREKLISMIEKFASEKDPLCVTLMVSDLGPQVTGRSAVTSQLSYAKKTHKHLHHCSIHLGKVDSRGHRIPEDAFWIDPTKLNPDFGKKRLTKAKGQVVGQESAVATEPKLSRDEMRQKAKAVRIRDALKNRPDPMLPITYFDLSLILGIDEKTVRTHGTASARWEPHVWRKEVNGRRMTLWYDESAVNPEYGSKPRPKAPPQTNLVQPEDVPWKPKVPAQPVHHTIATRDYRVNMVPEITEEMFATAIRTVNLFISQNQSFKLIVVEGELEAEETQVIKRKIK